MFQNETWFYLFVKRQNPLSQTPSYLCKLDSSTPGEEVRSHTRECVRNLDLRVQVHPGGLWVSKQRVDILLEASNSAGAKGDVTKTCGFMHPF